MELVHIGLVRKGIAVDEIATAVRNAKRDAMRLVGGFIEMRSAEFEQSLAYDCGRNETPLS